MGPDPVQLNLAPMATLLKTAATPEAGALVDRVVALVIGHEQRKRMRSALAVQNLKQVVGAFIGDLLAYAPRNGSGAFVFRSQDRNSFTGTGVAYRQFTATVKALEGLKLIETIQGFRNVRHLSQRCGTIFRHIQGKASRFRATPALLALAKEFGVTAGDCREHFQQSQPVRPIVLKAKSHRIGNGKVKGATLAVPDTPETLRLADQVRTINAFLEGVDIRGGIHRGFYRGFEHGDLPGFQWNKGGRLYSIGPDSYQALKEADRLAMTLNGEAVVEIDIRSSYLTILHGISGIPIDLSTDPYGVPGVPRKVVKGWLVATLGAEKPLRRWPSSQITAYREKTGRDLGRDHPISKVGSAMLQRFPALQMVGKPGLGWADLMFRESEVIIQTMLALVAAGVPSLPVHDSIIVPASACTLASDLLTASFEGMTGLKPGIEINNRTIGDR